MLRVAVDGGGCNGFQYRFDFDDAVNDDDTVFERDGVKVVVDEISLDFLGNAQVDFQAGADRQLFCRRKPQRHVELRLRHQFFGRLNRG